MSTLLGDARLSVNSLKSELDDLRVTIVAIDSTVCNLDNIISSIRSSSDTQERKADTLSTASGDADVFISDVVTVDESAAEAITTSEDDFYDEYPYLKPEDETLLDTLLDLGGDALDLLCDAFELAFDVWCLGWEALGEALAPAWEWCKDHWKEILLTVVIIIGVVLTIVAVVASGGLALAPLLMALGVSASAAATISGIVGIGAIAFAVLSGVFNVWDTWSPLEGGWKTVQTICNWGNLICGGLYNIGCLYNSIFGISNAQLKAFGAAIRNPATAEMFNELNWGRILKYRFQFLKAGIDKNSSMLWAGYGPEGETIAGNIASGLGRETVGQVMQRAGIAESEIVNWAEPSIAYILQSSGDLPAYLGPLTGTLKPGGAVAGDVFLNYESVIAPMSRVSSFRIIPDVGLDIATLSSTYNLGNFARGFQSTSAIRGAIALGETIYEWWTNR
jgi:hypothetical protein